VALGLSEAAADALAEVAAAGPDEEPEPPEEAGPVLKERSARENLERMKEEARDLAELLEEAPRVHANARFEAFLGALHGQAPPAGEKVPVFTEYKAVKNENLPS